MSEYTEVGYAEAPACFFSKHIAPGIFRLAWYAEIAASMSSV